MTGTAAASAISDTVSAARLQFLGAEPVVATLMTSSTRPRIRKYPSGPCVAPSPAKYGQSRQSVDFGSLLYLA